MAECSTCGQLTPNHLMVRGLCPGCQYDTWIPKGFEGREKYVYSEVWKHSNATVRPPLGVAFLDRAQRLSVQQLMLYGKKA